MNAASFPPVTGAHVLNCSFSSWYSLYKPLTPKSRVIKPLPKEFLQYLDADGIHLPGREDTHIEELSDAEGDESDASSNASFSTASDAGDPSTSFPSLDAQIRTTIAELDGAVLPKLNWSSPQDATWISADNTMKCTSASDVYIMLKSSDFINHDLDHPFDDCDKKEGLPFEYELVLRKWFEIVPSMEFRCFVRSRTLLGISQRDSNHYDFLANIEIQLTELIESFFEEKLKKTFPDPDFVFDVYVTQSLERVWLIDINAFSPSTDTLLFTWPEILDMPHGDGDEEAEEIDFRLVHKGDNVGTFNAPAYSAHRVPKDVVDASSGADIAEFAEKWRKLVAESAIGV
ncbi:hypothetical protein G7K_3834-t1 [Saitoella complicata NRRL Y-17804]|uniref:Cell division cycle protein 123 n=1 Tax=Saitoella complicata (strain BCRC 22490 / CBS 7301 / JCM 7358 / NBRC 10748 / NRRL Y-17804) TaxID=698492 RepID=A0A0E9NIP8_SAICN|nr:hypothetical protein G7K_3834-t1 [Saitoella complicata NRRL Y-17804]